MNFFDLGVCIERGRCPGCVKARNDEGERSACVLDEHAGNEVTRAWEYVAILIEIRKATHLITFSDFTQTYPNVPRCVITITSLFSFWLTIIMQTSRSSRRATRTMSPGFKEAITISPTNHVCANDKDHAKV